MNYKIDHIPFSRHKRPGSKLDLRKLTIHSTANLKSTAQNERDNLARESNKRSASFHIVVDEKEAIECVPLNEVTHHAGKMPGNRQAISIELCESGNRAKVLDNGARVAAAVLKANNLRIEDMNRHFDWSGKNCPRILSMNNWKGWWEFREMVKKYLEQLEKGNVKEVSIPVRLHGHKDNFKGIKHKGKNYVPIRDLAERLGYEVGYNSNKEVTLQYNNK